MKAGLPGGSSARHSQAEERVERPRRIPFRLPRPALCQPPGSVCSEVAFGPTPPHHRCWGFNSAASNASPASITARISASSSGRQNGSKCSPTGVTLGRLQPQKSLS